MSYELLYCAQAGCYEKVKKLLEKDKVNPDFQESNSGIVTVRQGCTALMLACAEGHADIVELLLKHNATIDKKDFFGRTALLYSALNGRENCLILLLDHQNNDNINYVDNQGDTALMYAASQGKHQIVKILIHRGADLSLSNNNGETALIRAIKYGCIKTVTILIEAKINIDQTFVISYNDGIAYRHTERTALIEAAFLGDTKIVELLLNHGANIEHTTRWGFTAIFEAVLQNNFETTRLLIQRGAKLDRVIQHGQSKKSLIHVASDAEHLEMLKFLIASGVPLNTNESEIDKLKRLKYLKEPEKIKKILFSAFSLFEQIIKGTLTPSNLKELLENGAHLNQREWESKNTPIHLVCLLKESKSLEIILNIIAKLPDDLKISYLSAVNLYNETALDISARINDKKSIYLLMNRIQPLIDHVVCDLNRINLFAKLNQDIAECIFEFLFLKKEEMLARQQGIEYLSVGFNKTFNCKKLNDLIKKNNVNIKNNLSWLPAFTCMTNKDFNSKNNVITHSKDNAMTDSKNNLITLSKDNAISLRNTENIQSSFLSLQEDFFFDKLKGHNIAKI